MGFFGCFVIEQKKTFTLHFIYSNNKKRNFRDARHGMAPTPSRTSVAEPVKHVGLQYYFYFLSISCSRKSLFPSFNVYTLIQLVVQFQSDFSALSCSQTQTERKVQFAKKRFILISRNDCCFTTDASKKSKEERKK